MPYSLARNQRKLQRVRHFIKFLSKLGGLKIQFVAFFIKQHHSRLYTVWDASECFELKEGCLTDSGIAARGYEQYMPRDQLFPQ